VGHSANVARDHARESAAYREHLLPLIFRTPGWEDEDTYGTDEDLRHDVDRIARRTDGAEVRLSLRVQFLEPGEKRWDTITIRYERVSGEPTQYQKMQSGESHATHYLHAYIRENENKLESWGLATAEDTLAAAEAALSNKQIRTNAGEDGRPVKFIWIGFADIPTAPSLAVTAAFGTCSYSKKHKAHHGPHPLTGRPICWLCHPPTTSPET
jgi:hypothetical protein